MKFKKILKYFIIVLIILSVIFIGYVYITLVSYENGIPENIIIKKINDQQYLNDIQIANNYESNYDVYKYISDLLSSKKGEIKTLESNDKNITFGIIEDKQLLAKITLSKTFEKNGLYLLKINHWDLASSELFSQNDYTISIPENYKLFINDKIVNNEKNIKSDNNIKNLCEIDKTIKQQTTYNFNFITNPKIKILDNNGNDVSFNNSKNIYVSTYKKANTLSEAKQYLKYDYNPMEFVKNWSLFMSNDLIGGFNVIKNDLIKDSYLYNKAHSFAKSDALQINEHALYTKIFDNEKLSDFILYSDDSFSCIAEIDKNVVVRNKKIVVHTSDRFFFTYKDGTYKVVDMQSVKK